MRVEVLGPVRAYADDGAPIDLGGARVSALLANLALATGEVVSVASLVDAMWGDQPPGDPVNALHALVHRLRRALGDAEAVQRAAGGYRLAGRADDVDAVRFENLVTAGELDEALALWHGDALADVRDVPFAGAAAARLEELRVTAMESKWEAELQLGRHEELLPDLASLAARYPLRERLAALRMRALSAAGRQSEALEVFEAVRETLAEELGIDPSEELRATHLAVLRGELEAPRRAPPQVMPGRLPAQLTTFVGRANELELLARLLDASRLVTVVGPGGVGKTRLAVETVSGHRAHRRGRVWLVPLAGVTTPEGLPEAVLGQLTTADAAVAGTPLERVVNLLAGGEGVLVLDNCEQVAGPVAAFAQHVLERQPDLTILATSREPLEVIGEALCRLHPLALPPADADPDHAGQFPAVRLFLDRAGAVRPGFDVDHANGEAVVDIVRRLDGLPLALELAAARLRTMTPDQIAEALDDRFRLLNTGNRAAQPRQQTLHAVIDWSWDLLSEPERALARRMSIFPATTASAALEAVCSDDTLPAHEVAYVLESLVDRSIVERAGDAYRMLETIRAYASDKLQLAAEHDITLGALTRYFADFAETHEPLLRSERQVDCLRSFEAAYDNLIFALHTAIDLGDADAAARMLAPLYWYWLTCRYEPRADGYLARVLAFDKALPEHSRAACTMVRLLTTGGWPITDREGLRAIIDDCAQTGALSRYPVLLTTTLMPAAAMGLNDVVDREIARVRGGTDRWAIACTFAIETWRSREQGDWPHFISAAEAALHAFEELGDRAWTATMLSGLALIHSIGGEHDKAIALHERGMAIATELRSQDEIATRLELATTRMRAGDLEGARRDIASAARMAGERGQPVLEIEAAVILAEVYRRCGEIERAHLELDRIERLGSGFPGVMIETRVLPVRMAAALAAGDTARAREQLPSAIQAAQAHSDAPTAAQLLARLLFLEGDVEGAATALGMSRAIRGMFDRGDLELASLAAQVAEALGPRAYDAAYQRGATMSRHEAIASLQALGGG